MQYERRGCKKHTNYAFSTWPISHECLGPFGKAQQHSITMVVSTRKTQSNSLVVSTRKIHTLKHYGLSQHEKHTLKHHGSLMTRANSMVNLNMKHTQTPWLVST